MNKEEKYAEALLAIHALIDDESDLISAMSTVAQKMRAPTVNSSEPLKTDSIGTWRWNGWNHITFNRRGAGAGS